MRAPHHLSLHRVRSRRQVLQPQLVNDCFIIAKPEYFIIGYRAFRKSARLEAAEQSLTPWPESDICYRNKKNPAKDDTSGVALRLHPLKAVFGMNVP
jgi:hypothetical protein